MRGSDYAELRALAAIVEHGGFARAAGALGVSASALSQTIRSLEERLGVRLLNRTTRSVAPTEAGARLLARLVPALADVEAAVAEATALRERPAGVLRINSTRLAAIHYLGPLIGPFLDAHPDITLDLVVEERLIDIVAGRFDAGVRLGERLQRDMIAVPLGGALRLVVVGAPAYFAAHPAPASPHDLRNHRCINFRTATNLDLYRWEFERDGRALNAAVEGALITNEPEVALQAAIAGVGLAFLFEDQVRPHVEAGRLVQALDDWTPPFPGFFLYYPSRRQTPPPLRAFIDFLRATR
jgi:DNA-binding transcriptional LysR family regulator